ncbi:beta-N-acetylhexosaminidase [Rhabdochromatium marinum]|uniref:beta-N-acetylhexosaminidase n=1 Tax=Rhabdochromatium marinum TaxID=48729 RepID=UPI0019043901|nr:beta-N-acetylhexosaminidase [Rhabdochromatium marinum]MBK1650094.1 beta-N-acetylhexosaminidase [Rhabdochromatium marinum]
MSTGIGPVMLDLEAETLSGEECELLDHPAVGGVILFSRNYQDPAQLRALTASIRAARTRPLLIAVDQEGGRVQRFRDGFTRFPPLRTLGQLYASDPDAARQAAGDLAWLLATELLEAGLDFSFAPVLDLDYGLSTVIGDRAFATEAATVAELASAWIAGTQAAGMISCGKHFPGHGGVVEDSHAEFPVDRRSLKTLREQDLAPFKALIAAGLEAVMPAHVVYPAVDTQPAGFSTAWLQQVLRTELGFQGVIFSDDLSMTAAEVAGSYPDRARVALAAGCDMVILCNNRPAAVAVVDALADFDDPASAARLLRLPARQAQATSASTLRHARAQEALARLRSVAE